MAFGDILEKAKELFTGGNHSSDNAAQQPVEQDNSGILPASQDPMGDPAEQGGILPASQDPMGDPANDASNGGQYGGENILPASQDPLGDPADDQKS